MITYDDFAKLDITIGEIKTVDIVEDADRLLRLTVDFAETDEEGSAIHRQIVSGIREYYEDPQSLVGTKCPFLTNLEPRTIRGLESQGMILAASHEDSLGLLVPSVDMPAGTKIA